MDEEDYITRHQKAATIAAGLALALLGLIWTIAGMNVPSRGQYVAISPALLPTWSGIALAVSGVALAVAYYRKPVSMEAEEEPLFELPGQIRVWAIQAVLLAYILAIESFHYALTTFVATLLALIIAGEGLRWPLIAKAAGLTAFMFIVFILWLGTPLPGSRFV